MEIKILAIGTAACAATIFSLAFQFSAVSLPQEHIENFVKTSYEHRFSANLSAKHVSYLWSGIATVVPIGALFGPVVSWPIADKFGRKFTVFMLNPILVITGAIAQRLCRIMGSFEVLIVGRIFLGLAYGIGLAVTGIYLTEISKMPHRGTMGSLITFFMGLGIAVGVFLSFEEILGSENKWPYLLGATVVPACISPLFYKLYPESPAYL